jgi:hypothetical protein
MNDKISEIIKLLRDVDNWDDVQRAEFKRRINEAIEIHLETAETLKAAGSVVSASLLMTDSETAEPIQCIRGSKPLCGTGAETRQGTIIKDGLNGN